MSATFVGMYTLKKSLGQHFLRDENVVLKIVDALQACTFSNLLEVGPGGGSLTKHLLNLHGVNFKAVELDEEKVNYLLKNYPALQQKLIHESVLNLQPPFQEPFAVVGNFPYNISTEILFKMLEWGDLVTCMVGMFQKEVAQRIAASEGNKVYGVTSVLVQAFYDVEYLFDVKETCFDPPPKVKSGVIRMLPRHTMLKIRNRADLFRLVKAAFGQRRKMLRNATKDLFSSPTLQQSIFDRRAEQLKVEEFAALTFEMK